MFTLINPVARAAPFDDPDWIFEVKFDGFRAAPTPFAAGLSRTTAIGCSGSLGCSLGSPRTTWSREATLGAAEVSQLWRQLTATLARVDPMIAGSPCPGRRGD